MMINNYIFDSSKEASIKRTYSDQLERGLQRILSRLDASQQNSIRDLKLFARCLVFLEFKVGCMLDTEQITLQ